MALADRRVAELVERWQASLVRHAQYLALDDAAYARAEAWPKHQRPNAWVIELARKRLQELRGLLEQRSEAKDDEFAEALELMSFLTNLLGSEHIERFIPLATGKPQDTGTSATVEQPRMRSAQKPAGARINGPPTSASGRHAIPRAQPGNSRRPSSSQPANSSSSARASTSASRASASSGRTATAAAASRPAARNALTADAAAPSVAKDAVSRQVIADAVRMLEWGKEWPALAGLIARMADRPSESGVWKILRAHRNEILTRARRPAS
jgi:hypothetical protein